MSSSLCETGSRTAAVKFSGQYGQYFRLWIVNASLTILSLGIYGVWAKVRNTKYIYGHLRLEDHPFRYLATPLQLLLGRVVVFVVYVVLVLISSLYPAAGWIISLLFLLVTPWLVVRRLCFSMSMIAYRNVRFSFHGTYIGALVNFFLLPILGLVTLLLAMPWVLKRIDRFIYSNIGYGGRKFELNTSLGTYYRAAAYQIAILLIGIAVLVTVATYLGVFEQSQLPPLTWIIGSAIVIILLFYVVSAIQHAIILNHIIQSLRIDGVVSFEANIKTSDFVWLMLSNRLLILLSLGLAYPVTVIRKTTFLAQAMSINLEAAADDLISTASGQQSAIGEEAASFFDVDVSLS